MAKYEEYDEEFHAKRLARKKKDEEETHAMLANERYNEFMQKIAWMSKSKWEAFLKSF